MHNVFISFSSKDMETALHIFDGLTSRAVKCWISSKHVPPGGNYMNEIVNALVASSVMVLVYSRNANLSKEIERELALAGQHQLTVIPLKIDDVVPSGAFIYSLATSQWIEVFPNIDKTLDMVAATIKVITDKTEKFALEVQDALEKDGVIEPTDLKYLEEDIGAQMGLTSAQSRAIIKRVVGDPTRSTVHDREHEYLKLVAEVLEDGKITSLEKRRLIDRAKYLGINDVRAEALLKQENIKICADASKSHMGSLSTANIPDESEEDGESDEGQDEATDRSYWEAHGSKATVAMIDDLLGILKQIEPTLELNYRKKYIGLARRGRVDNFVIFRPKKNFIRVEPRLKVSDEIVHRIGVAGLDLMNRSGYSKRYRIRLDKDSQSNHAEILYYLFSIAYKES